MDNRLLQPFLQAGLIDIGDSDERLANIEKSIADLQAVFEKNNSVLPIYTLVAMDPETPTDEQVLIDTEAVIAVHWKALRAKFSEQPVPIIRAVILNALYNVGIANAHVARIIYLTGSNFYSYVKLGKEKKIVEQIISELGDVAERDAIQEWGLSDDSPSLKIKSLKITGLSINTVEIDKAKLKAGLKTAVSNEPTYGHGSNNGGNGHWGEHFANNASEAIASAYDTAISGLKTGITPSSIENPINNYFVDFKKALDEVLQSSFDSIRAVERRSKLLWWKETLYSPSIKNSYRTLNAYTQPIVMAADLYEQLPEVSPASVDFLLKDTLLILNNNASERISFSSIMKEISNDTNKLLLKNYIRPGKETGRITITDFVALLVNDKVKPSNFRLFTGISEAELTSLSDISVIILHDLLTRYLISE